MHDFAEAVRAALGLITAADADLVEIVALSLRVSFAATLLACLIGAPLGAALGALRFPGRGVLAAIVNALMGLPPVVAGLTVYLLISASGPLGALGLLYTPTAMIIAQTILITPIVAALTRQAVADLHAEYDETLRTLGAGRMVMIGALLYDARFALVTAALAGLGRALAEVGAVMIVGGNINHVTRVMTTAIALETSRGDLALALGLGMILLTLSLIINASVMAVAAGARRKGYA